LYKKRPESKKGFLFRNNGAVFDDKTNKLLHFNQSLQYLGSLTCFCSFYEQILSLFSFC